MKILVHCMNRDGWQVHSIAEDCRTVLSPFVDVSSMDTLRRLMRYAGANDAEMEDFEEKASKYSHTSCWISNLTEDGARLLRIDVKKLIRSGG